jgi:NAD(P)H-dependent flavin oxidoreductase YrpB (nitropropane dioxygenase family)
MGAGIPREIPGALDALAAHRSTTMRMEVEGLSPGESEQLIFDPQQHLTSPRDPLPRPRFLPIVSAYSLALTLARKATGRVDGLVVEGPTAGGHNAPPRGEPRLNERGEPVYGERDAVDLEKMRDLGLPFWLAGGTGSPDELRRARAEGAAGIQVGTLFAYCQESGVAAPLKAAVLRGVQQGTVRIHTAPRASPTGYPFKIVQLEGMSAQDERRERICDLGYLRAAYRTPQGRLGYRCPAEPVADYVAKGGDPADTVGRRCLCNGLTANIGLAQRREDGVEERPLLTSGDCLPHLGRFLGARSEYSAAEVVAYLRQGLQPATTLHG